MKYNQMIKQINKKGMEQALLYLVLSVIFILVMVLLLTQSGKDAGRIIDVLPFF